jgi:hypothetical protein
MAEPEKLTAAVLQAMSETFEGMAFLELMLDDSDPDNLADESAWAWAAVAITSPGSGRFAVVCPHDLLQMITEQLFSEGGAPVSEQQLVDTLGEIVNTVAGRCLSLCVPAEKVFTLGLPQCGKGWPAAAPGKRLGYATDDGIRLFVITDLPEMF